MTVGILAAHDDAKHLAARLTDELSVALGQRCENVEFHVENADADPADPAADERELIEATRRRRSSGSRATTVARGNLREPSTRDRALRRHGAAHRLGRARRPPASAGHGACQPPHARCGRYVARCAWRARNRRLRALLVEHLVAGGRHERFATGGAAKPSPSKAASHPPSSLQETVRHAVSIGDYARLGWLVASISTLGGALGSLITPTRPSATPSTTRDRRRATTRTAPR